MSLKTDFTSLQFFLSVFHVTHLPARRREIRLELKREDWVLKDLVIAKGWPRKLQKSMMHMQLLSCFISLKLCFRHCHYHHSFVKSLIATLLYTIMYFNEDESRAQFFLTYVCTTALLSILVTLTVLSIPAVSSKPSPRQLNATSRRGFW